MATPEGLPGRQLRSAPGLVGLYARAVRPRRYGGGPVPERCLVLRGLAPDPDRLRRYAVTCGFADTARVPGSYPHVLAFPLAMSLMTRGDFPFPLLGLVHVANVIEHRRPLGPEEPLDYRVWAAPSRPHPRGTAFDVVAEASDGGGTVWRSVSTYLHREAGRGAVRTGSAAEPGAPSRAASARATERGLSTSGATDPADRRAPAPGAGRRAPEGREPAGPGSEGRRSEGRGPAGPDLESLGPGAVGQEWKSVGPGPVGPGPVGQGRAAAEPERPPREERWEVPAGTGRRYAAVSGDRNPIHLHPLAARLFGFRRAIAHGMWTTARSLAALSDVLPDAYRLEVAFRAPVLLPAQPRFRAARSRDGWEFVLGSADGRREHLRGSVSPLG